METYGSRRGGGVMRPSPNNSLAPGGGVGRPAPNNSVYARTKSGRRLRDWQTRDHWRLVCELVISLSVCDVALPMFRNKYPSRGMIPSQITRISDLYGTIVFLERKKRCKFRRSARS
jgi:hypothetical protein